MKKYDDAIKDCGKAKLLCDYNISQFVNRTCTDQSLLKLYLNYATKATLRLITAHQHAHNIFEAMLVKEFLQYNYIMQVEHHFTPTLSTEEITKIDLDFVEHIKSSITDISEQKITAFIEKSLKYVTDTLSNPQKSVLPSISPRLVLLISKSVTHNPFALKPFCRHNGLSVFMDKRLQHMMPYKDLLDHIIELTTLCNAEVVRPYMHLINPPPKESDIFIKDYFVFHSFHIIRNKNLLNAVISKSHCQLFALAATRFMDITSIKPISCYSRGKSDANNYFYRFSYVRVLHCLLFQHRGGDVPLARILSLMKVDASSLINPCLYYMDFFGKNEEKDPPELCTGWLASVYTIFEIVSETLPFGYTEGLSALILRNLSGPVEGTVKIKNEFLVGCLTCLLYTSHPSNLEETYEWLVFLFDLCMLNKVNVKWESQKFDWVKKFLNNHSDLGFYLNLAWRVIFKILDFDISRLEVLGSFDAVLRERLGEVSELPEKIKMLFKILKDKSLSELT